MGNQFLGNEGTPTSVRADASQRNKTTIRISHAGQSPCWGSSKKITLYLDDRPVCSCTLRVDRSSHLRRAISRGCGIR